MQTTNLPGNIRFNLHQTVVGFVTHGGDDTELLAYWIYGLFPFEKSNCIVHLYDGIVGNMTFSIVIFDSIVVLNVLRSVVVVIVFTVVPDVSVQMTETLSSGGALNCLPRACQSYVTLHIRIALRPSTTG